MNIRKAMQAPVHAQRDAPCQALPLTAREAKIQCLLGEGQEMASLHPC